MDDIGKLNATNNYDYIIVLYKNGKREKVINNVNPATMVFQRDFNKSGEHLFEFDRMENGNIISDFAVVKQDNSFSVLPLWMKGLLTEEGYKISNGLYEKLENFCNHFDIIPKEDAMQLWEDGDRSFVVLATDGTDRYAECFETWEEIEENFPDALFGLEK